MKTVAVIAFLATISLRAATIVDVPGPPSGSEGNRVLAASWTQTSAYDYASIMADVFGESDPGVIATAWLTTAIGPGATVADQVATASITSSTIFSDLTLTPQTYYLVLLFNSGEISAGWNLTSTPAPTTAPGVTIGSSYKGAALDFPSFGPSASVAPTSSQFIYTVSGLHAAPEPTSLLLFGSALLSVVGLIRRRARRT